MKSIASFCFLVAGGLKQSSAFLTVKTPTAFGTTSKIRQLAIFTTSEATQIDSIQQDANKDLLLLDQTTVESAAESTFRAEKLLGVSTATAILSYLVLSHSDTSIVQSISPTLQHLTTNAVSHTWGAYQSVLAENPITTKACTSATVYSIGDVIAQKAEGLEGLDELDKGRVLRSLLAGGIGHGPLSHVWYNLSEEFFNHVVHLTDWWSFLPKIVVDQTIWGPIWNSTYILLLGMMKRESIEKMFGDVQSTTIPLFLDGLKLWPIAHCVTYGLVPVENRLLWVDLVEILWVSILAKRANEQSMTKLDGVKI